MTTMTETSVAQVNGVPLCGVDDVPDAEGLRQRACTELLRQAAMAAQLLSADDPPPRDGAISAAASAAIEQLLDRHLQIPDADDAACRRYFEANAARFGSGEAVTMRHVLFAVTPGVDVAALRKRAESCLIDLRCAETEGSDRFARMAADLSNCPSGAQGGNLGTLRQADCAAEFAREIFGQREVGVLPRLIHSRFGFHVVEVLDRAPGSIPSFEHAHAAVALLLQRQGFATALRQYLQVLAGEAELVGIELEAGTGMLVQ